MCLYVYDCVRACPCPCVRKIVRAHGRLMERNMAIWRHLRMPRDGQLGRVLQLADWGHSGQDLRRTRLLHHRKVHCARFCLFCGALRAPARRQPAPVVGQGPLSTRRIPRTRPRTAPLRGMRVTHLPRVLPQLLAGLEVVVVVPFPRVGVMLLPSAGAPRCSQRCAPRTRQRLRAAGSNRFSAMGGRLRGVGAAGHPSGSGSSSSIPPLLSLLLLMNFAGRSRGSRLARLRGKPVMDVLDSAARDRLRCPDATVAAWAGAAVAQC